MRVINMTDWRWLNEFDLIMTTTNLKNEYFDDVKLNINSMILIQCYYKLSTNFTKSHEYFVEKHQVIVLSVSGWKMLFMSPLFTNLNVMFAIIWLVKSYKWHKIIGCSTMERFRTGLLSALRAEKRFSCMPFWDVQ